MIVLWVCLALGGDPSPPHAPPGDLVHAVAPVAAEPGPSLRAAPPPTEPGPDGAGETVLLGGAALAAWLVARVLRRTRRALLPDGVLPRGTATGELIGTATAAILALAALASLVPGSLAPALPLVIVALVVAVGWSARDLLPDLIAGLLLATERRVLRGDHLVVEPHAGRVEHVGARVTVLHDAAGRRVTVPNRDLVRHPTVHDRGRWPLVEVRVDVGPDVGVSVARRALHDAVVLAPWTAPESDVQLLPDTDRPGRWTVRARLLEARFGDRLGAALCERADRLARGP